MTTTTRTALAAALPLLLTLAACGSTKTEYVTVTAPESTYLVEYLPGMMGAVAGKTTFQLRVRTRADYKAATGLAITVKPVMTMPAYDHGAPADLVTESATPGTYDCAVYYQMASGAGMGYWELTATIGAESVTFVPSVAMAMGSDTVKANLWGVSDAAVPDTASTKYVIFKDGPLLASAGSLKLYVSRAEDMMMTFKPVSAGSVLGGPTGTVSSVSLTAYAATDTAFATPLAAVDGGHGHWSVDVSSLGLTAGAQATVNLKLKVNGEDKTTNGLAPAGANASVAFKVTPQ
jgi:hypothetical protein